MGILLLLFVGGRGRSADTNRADDDDELDVGRDTNASPGRATSRAMTVARENFIVVPKSKLVGDKKVSRVESKTCQRGEKDEHTCVNVLLIE